MLIVGCMATKSDAQNLEEKEVTSFPAGVLYFGNFEPGNPKRCAYLDRIRNTLSPEAETWLVEHKIGDAGFPINFYGKDTPEWAKDKTVYVYCEE